MMIRYNKKYSLIILLVIIAVLLFIVCVVSKVNNNKDAGDSSRQTVTLKNESSENNTESNTDFSITYDFYYTTETLNGEKLKEMYHTDADGNIVVDEEKCRNYVDYLADKYDTFGKPRKFHATLQGNIVVPNSDDAVYGWLTDKEKTCEELIKMIKEGETVKRCEPVYYDNGYGYTYDGVRSARNADDDIGDTYIEIDLSAQHLWVYINGKVTYQCDIVSGQSTSITTLTLPGVYKLWYKGQNYPLNGSNADGESWSSTCNYWNLVSICGIGLHDTVNRNAFGGNEFRYNGSKGCVNMPLEGAKYVYEQVPLGTPVVMYYSEEQYREFGLNDQ